MAPTSKLVIRSRYRVALAYILGPLIGITAIYILTTIPDAYQPNVNFQAALMAWGLTLLFGGLLCLLVELLVIRPIIDFHQKTGGNWLNGCTGAALGFALGALPWFAFSTWELMSPNYDELAAGALVASHAVTTTQDWVDAATEALEFGSVGVVAAVVFRLVAVRKADRVRLAE